MATILARLALPRRLSQYIHGSLALLVVAVCVCSLVGWLLDVRILTSFLRGRPSLTPMSAIALLIAARALASIKAGKEARKLAFLQVLIGLLIVGAHWTGLAGHQTSSPWSWSSRVTGVALALSGSATWLLASGRRRQGQVLAFVTVLLSVLVGIGHLLPRADLYDYLPGHGVAIPTVVAFLALSVGQLVSFPESGISAALRQRSAAGRTGLRLILAGPIVPFVVCLLAIEGYQRGAFDAETAVMLVGWSAIVLLSSTLWALAIAVEKAERARQMAEQHHQDLRRMLVAALSHDVRSPLQAATLSTMVLERTADEEQKAAFVRLQRSHRRIDRLLRFLLDSLALDSGRGLRLQPSPVELVALLHEVIEENEELLRDRVVVEGEPLQGWWDHDALFRVVENLLMNVVKYGLAGGRIWCKIEALADGRAHLSVSNQGSPIPREEWETIFLPFSRGQGGLRSGQPGWGVGLAYARAILELHGGSIEVESSNDEGTTFAVTLPIDSRGGGREPERISSH